jgi:putative Mg2+ transporter-C (MgtC) family protein
MDYIASLLGEWSSELGVYSVLLRIALSIFMGAIVGWERSKKLHSAGLRTFMLVMLAGNLAMMADMFLAQAFGSTLFLLSVAAIIGIATISANSFLYSSRNQIKGLTTAVALWTCVFIGLAIGGGFYTLGLIGFVALFICLSFLTKTEKFFKDRSNYFQIHLELKSPGNLQEFITTVRRLNMRTIDIELNPAYANSGLSVYSISIAISDEERKKYKSHQEIIDALSTLDYISHVEEIA